MGSHPINLALRFGLELGALAAMAYWGWTGHVGAARWIWAIGLPIGSAVAWATFAVPHDPSRSGAAPLPVPGVVRLVLELGFFAAASLQVAARGRERLAIVSATVVLLHYAFSYDRVSWLLKQRPTR